MNCRLPKTERPRSLLNSSSSKSMLFTLLLRSSTCFLSPKNSLSLQRLVSSSAMDPNSASILVLCGKSNAEREIAISLKANNTLKFPDNSEVSVVLHSQMNSLSMEEPFCADLFLNFLSTNRFGRFLIWSPRLPSTHDVVSHNFSELPVGSACVADVQFKGRGRTSNVWESPMGCLLFSFTIQMENGRIVPLLQYVVSLAMTEAIKEVCNKNGLPQLDVKIKWPNDLYLNGQKVGGILCTSTYKAKMFNVSAGIGLNIDNKEPTTCLNAVLSELSAADLKLRREDILASFFNKFENFYDLFINQVSLPTKKSENVMKFILAAFNISSRHIKALTKLRLMSSIEPPLWRPNHLGFKTLEELYYKTWLHSGQRVTVLENNEDKVVETVATIQGLTSSGYLLAVGEDNQICQLHPDGNSFDFFQGLVKRKLD